MGEAAMQLEEKYTYGQYRSWTDDERWELIDGLAWMMSAPSDRHQAISFRLSGELYVFLKGKPCLGRAAPFDVLLPRSDEADDDINTVVQPDLVVFCDRTRIRKANARGAPDLVIEILSLSTQRKDWNEKFRLYERVGVREYWVIDPISLAIWVFHLVEDAAGRHYDQGLLREQFRDWSRVESTVLVGFSIDPGELFADLD